MAFIHGDSKELLAGSVPSDGTRRSPPVNLLAGRAIMSVEALLCKQTLRVDMMPNELW